MCIKKKKKLTSKWVRHFQKLVISTLSRIALFSCWNCESATKNGVNLTQSWATSVNVTPVLGADGQAAFTCRYLAARVWSLLPPDPPGLRIYRVSRHLNEQTVQTCSVYPSKLLYLKLASRFCWTHSVMCEKGASACCGFMLSCHSIGKWVH